MCVCVCMCMFVCVCEREREREGESGFQPDMSVSLLQEDFVRPLVSLILQKVDERVDLMMRLAS